MISVVPLSVSPLYMFTFHGSGFIAFLEGVFSNPGILIVVISMSSMLIFKIVSAREVNGFVIFAAILVVACIVFYVMAELGGHEMPLMFNLILLAVVSGCGAFFFGKQYYKEKYKNTPGADQILKCPWFFKS